MNAIFIGSKQPALLLCLAGVAIGGVHWTLADTHVWSGAVDNNWSTGGNWTSGAAPSAGDDLVFPKTATRFNATNNYASGTTFRSILFEGTGYSLGGNNVGLSSSLIASNAIGANVIYAPLTISGSLTVILYDSLHTLTLEGPISGPGGMQKWGYGTLVLAGGPGTANTYAGSTTVYIGKLRLAKTIPNAAIPGSLTVNYAYWYAPWAAVVEIAGVEQIHDSAAITILDNGYPTNACVDINISGSETVGGLSGGGRVKLLAGTLILGNNEQSTYYNGVISGPGSLTKVGGGTLTLTGENSYWGDTIAQGGSLLVNGYQSQSAVSVVAGATLGGGGTVGNLTCTGGFVAPAGRLFCGNLLLNPASSFLVELNGTGSFEFDQLRVAGTCQLGAASLGLQLGFVPPEGYQFIILDSSSPIIGTFAGLSEGDFLDVNGQRLQVSYAGGNGTDVILTAVGALGELAVSPTVLTPSCIQGTDAVSESFEVWNIGGGTLDYTVSESLSWLSCTPASGTSTGEHDTITVNYTTAGLAPGTYNGTITVTGSGASGSPQTVAVTLTVRPAVDIVYVTACVSNCTSTTTCGSGPNVDYNPNTGGLIYNDMGFGAYTSAKANAPDKPITPGSRYFSTSFYSSSPAVPFVGIALNPALGVPGGVYRLYHVYSSSAGNTSTNVVLGVTNLETCTLSFDETDKFQRSYGVPVAGQNVWQFLGFVTNSPGMSNPKIGFYYKGGGVNAGTSQRLIVEVFKFQYAEPCSFIPEVWVDGPLAANVPQVTVTGMDSAATRVTVYQDSGSGMAPIGSTDLLAPASTVSVNVAGLVKDAEVAATQTIGGQEGCVPTSGVRVGGGANPSIRLALNVRENTALTGPVGAVGSGSIIHMLGTTSLLPGGGPAQGVVLTPSTSWQTVSFTRGVDPLVTWAGTDPTPGTWDGAFGALDGIAIACEGDSGPYDLYIDDLANGVHGVFQDWEAAPAGVAAYGFSSPGYSGTTAGNILGLPNESLVSNEAAYSGTKSCRVRFQFNSNTADKWLRLVTTEAAPVANPQVDTSQPISFRILLLPPGATPHLAVSPTALTPGCIQGAEAASQSFEVWNSGGGALSYTVSKSVDWLSCTPTSGSSTGEHDTITVNYNTAGLTPGTYSGTISVTADGAMGSPQTVTVTLTVVEKPELYVSPTELLRICPYGEEPASQSFEVWNSGGGTLSYTISEDLSWLSCTPTSGSSTGEHDTITVHYSTAGLAPGTHYGTIMVTADGASDSPQEVWVTLNLMYPPPDDFNPGAEGQGPVLALAVQADGKIVVGGGFTRLGGQARDGIGRLNPDGTLDFAFDPGTDNWVSSLVVQADGKILLGGSFGTVAGQPRSRIARLNADGTLDASFNPGANGEVRSLVVQSDGKILVGGNFSTLAGQPRHCLGRLNADGTLDNSFNPDADGGVYSLAVQADGKIVVGGWFEQLGDEDRYCLGRLNADGTVDAGFDTSAGSGVYCLAVQADGKILVGGGFTSLCGQWRYRIGRLHPDGTLDDDFTPEPDGESVDVYSFAVQTDGKILVGGSFDDFDCHPSPGLARLNSDGTVDSTFNPMVGGEERCEVTSVALQADGKILVGGLFDTLGGQPRLNLGRLEATGPATQSLSGDGGTITWLRGGTSPEVWRTSFEVSADGSDWTLLGPGERIAGGWQLTGVSLPPGTSVRARGYVTGGCGNASGWFVESTLIPPPELAAGPTALLRGCPQGENAVSQTFEVWNIGGGTLDYTVSESLDWLSCTPGSGTIAREPHPIQVNYTTTGLEPGTYHGTITVGAAGVSGSPQTIAVTLTVEPSYRFTVSAGPPQCVAYGQEVSLHGSITNLSGGPLGELGYRWEQIPERGRSMIPFPVALTGENSPNLVFWAPDEETMLWFRLSVSTADGYTASDVVRVMVIETGAANIHVSAFRGNDTNSGSASAPVQTLGRAISIANDIPASSVSPVVWVEDGQYSMSTTWTLEKPVRLYGGFRYHGIETWTRGAIGQTRIMGAATAIIVDAPILGLHTDESKDSVIIDGFHIESARGENGGGPDGDGEDSMCIYVVRGKLVATHNVLKPGTGGRGNNGAPGAHGAPGGKGANATRATAWPEDLGQPGRGGQFDNGVPSGGSGGYGGGFDNLIKWATWVPRIGGDLTYGLRGQPGEPGAGQDQGGVGGAAPYDDRRDWCYYPVKTAIIKGSAGGSMSISVEPAQNGGTGNGGRAGHRGEAGRRGFAGAGGSGGGGGGSYYECSWAMCDMFSERTCVASAAFIAAVEALLGIPIPVHPCFYYGQGIAAGCGGGGGGGGEGGLGGQGGLAGGDSYGIIQNRYSDLRYSDNRFYLNHGGRGGDGGDGGRGALGGEPGKGYTPAKNRASYPPMAFLTLRIPGVPITEKLSWDHGELDTALKTKVGKGGDGQQGQEGGKGGRGGGGGGGNSIGVFLRSTGFLLPDTANEYLIAGSPGSGGEPYGSPGFQKNVCNLGPPQVPRNETWDMLKNLFKYQSVVEKYDFAGDLAVLDVKLEWQGGDVTPRLQTPSGQTITPDVSSYAPGMAQFEFRIFEHPEFGNPAGEWTLVLERSSSPDGSSDLVHATVGTFRNQKPVALANDIIVAAGHDGLAEAWADAGSYDPDPDDGIQVRQIPSGPYAVGVTQVTIEVTDLFGFVSARQATVTVLDQTPPRIEVPTIIVLRADAGGEGRTTISAHAMDNADPNPTIEVEGLGAYPVGTTEVVVRATDASGNIAEKLVKVVVIAEPKPVRPWINAYGFEEGTLSPFAPVSGNWSVLDGRLAQLNGSGLSLAQLDIGRFQEYTGFFEFIQLQGDCTMVCFARSDAGVDYRVEFGTNYCRLTLPGSGQPWETRTFTVADLDLPLGQTNMVMVAVTAAGVQVQLNNEVVHDEEWLDGMPLGDGLLALGTRDAITMFDNVMVSGAIQLNPVLRLAFDNGSAQDYSGFANHGVLLNGAAMVDDAHRGKVLSLDGVDDYVDLGTNSLLDLSDDGQATIAAWVKLAGSKSHHAIVTKGEWNDAYSLLINGDATDRLWTGNDTSVFSGDSVPLNTWAHVAVVINGNLATFYINGLPSGTVNQDRGNPIDNDPLHRLEIGREDRSHEGSLGRWYFHGLLDDVRLYAVALSEFEIRAVMGVPAPALAVGPTTVEAFCFEGTDATNATLEVWNSGGASFSYTVSEDISWLSCTPTSGTSTGELEVITVNYNTAGLAAGTYDGTITVTADIAMSSPQTVAVTLIVLGAPLACTLPASDVLSVGSNASATLNGTVNPSGRETTAWFEWGQRPLAYGNRTVPVNMGSGLSPVAVSAALENLMAGEVYHYRVVASNSLEVVCGSDQCFGPLLLTLQGADPVIHDCHVPFADPGGTVLASPRAIAGGERHSLAVRANGAVVGWGAGSSDTGSWPEYGQVLTPASATNAMAIAAGRYHSLALRGDRTVVGWGWNATGQTTIPADATNVVAVAGGWFHSLALRADGSVVGWGYSSPNQTTIPASAMNVVAIAAGNYHNLALRADGTVVAWGGNNYGQTNVPAHATNVVAIAAGGDHSLALQADGSVIGWGLNSSGQINVPASATNVVALAAGDWHSLALRANGSVVGWGDNVSGQITIPAAAVNVTAIAAGQQHNLVLRADGTLLGWGFNYNGQATIPSGLNTLDLPITVSGTVDVDTPGSYALTYSVTNPWGEVARATRTMLVVIDEPRFTDIHLAADGSVAMALDGLPGRTYLIEWSTNLVSWRPLTTVLVSSGPVNVTDPDAPNYAQRFYRARPATAYPIADFEAYPVGASVLFRPPSFSGSTSSYVDTSGAVPNYTWVTNVFPAGHGSDQVLHAGWTFKVGSTSFPWLRLTTHLAPNLPNPIVGFQQAIRFNVFADKSLYVAFGLRETNPTGAIGEDGGTSGTIEWVGGVNDSTTSPPVGRLIPANQWTTLHCFIPHDPVRAFTGNGVLTSTTGKGVLEELSLVPGSGYGPYNFYLDNFWFVDLTP